MVELPQGKSPPGAQPLVTVAMPVFNAGNFLRPAVESILAQTHANWELLIIDDNTTDGSLESLADITDPRVKIFLDGCNRGLAARLNQAIDLASGQFLARMDQDDISYPERFASQLALLNSAPELDVVAVRAIRISDDNAVLGFFPFALSHPEICARPWMGFYFPHPTWMGRIEWFRKYRYATPQHYFSEDQELLLRSYGESKFACVAEVEFAYRVHAKTNLKKRLNTRWAVCKLQAEHFCAKREFLFLMLSFCVLVLRMLNDVVSLAVRRALNKTPLQDQHGELASEAKRWEQLNPRFFARPGNDRQ